MKTEDSLRARVNPTEPVDPLNAGRAALGRGDWTAARLAFEAAIEKEESAEALEGLGMAAWWLDSADLVFDVRERAYRMYRERDDGLGAARMAVWLAWDTAAFRGEHAVANGWLQRAHRLLDGRPDSTEHAWLALRSGVFDLDEYAETVAQVQRHSTVTAYISRIVCSKARIDGDHAFICALLHDAGFAGLLFAITDFEGAESPPLEQLWTDVDALHERASGILATLWGLPSSVSGPVSGSPESLS